MSAKARMAASEKGYENGLGTMSAEERMAASAKSMLAAGIAWEKKYADFKRCVEMPEIGTPLHTWQSHQLSNGRSSLNAKIWKEIEDNKGSTVWSDQIEKLSDCFEQKNCAKIGITWEEKYAEFKSFDGMPKNGTPLYTWQSHQLRNGRSSLNAKIWEELAENNKGSTMLSDRREKLSDCFEQKNSAKIGIAWEEK
jgi:hypothetical protein